MEVGGSCIYAAILQEGFPPESTDSEASLDKAAIAASDSTEYLCPKGQALELENVTEHQTISCHPLLPFVSKILNGQTKSFHDNHKNECPIFSNGCNLLDTMESNIEPRSEIDAFMIQAVSLATQLSQNRKVEHMMQTIDNECSYFTGEMSLYCQNLLKPDTMPALKSTEIKEPIQQHPISNSVKNNSKTENKSHLKVKHLAPSKKRLRISYRNTQILREWLLEHADNPFPTDSEKDMLCLRTGLSLTKLNGWFVNSRRRILGQLGLRNYCKEIIELSK